MECLSLVYLANLKIWVGGRITEILILFAFAKKWVRRASKPNNQISVALKYLDHFCSMFIYDQFSIRLSLGLSIY